MGISGKYKRLSLPGIAIAILCTLPSCGGTDPDPQPGSGTGKVALFLTDNISFYKQVIATVTGVRIVNTAAEKDCMLLDSPVTLDIANLTDMAQYVDMAECADGSYNRIDISFRSAVQLMDQLGNPAACTFTSYIYETGEVRPLSCDQGTDICTISIRGGERNIPLTVIEDRTNALGVDFNLKLFEVEDFGDPACTVTMSTAMVRPTDFNSSGRAHSVTGDITELDADAKTFVLTVRDAALAVDYSGINPALQPNISQLLMFAQANGMQVNVLTGSIDLGSGSISANRLYVKAAGTVSGLHGAPTWEFDLNDGTGNAIDVSFKPPAEVQGAMTDGGWVDVKLEGYSVAKDEYLAAAIEVLPAGWVLDD